MLHRVDPSRSDRQEDSGTSQERERPAFKEKNHRTSQNNNFAIIWFTQDGEDAVYYLVVMKFFQDDQEAIPISNGKLVTNFKVPAKGHSRYDVHSPHHPLI